MKRISLQKGICYLAIFCGVIVLIMPIALGLAGLARLKKGNSRK